MMNHNITFIDWCVASWVVRLIVVVNSVALLLCCRKSATHIDASSYRIQDTDLVHWMLCLLYVFTILECITDWLLCWVACLWLVQEIVSHICIPATPNNCCKWLNYHINNHISHHDEYCVLLQLIMIVMIDYHEIVLAWNCYDGFRLNGMIDMIGSDAMVLVSIHDDGSNAWCWFETWKWLEALSCHISRVKDALCWFETWKWLEELNCLVQCISRVRTQSLFSTLSKWKLELQWLGRDAGWWSTKLRLQAKRFPVTWKECCWLCTKIVMFWIESHIMKW